MAEDFNRIFTAFYRKSFLFVKSYVHDDMVAEDIVTESLIKIWKKINHIEKGHIAPLLLTILKNAALDHLKHEEIKKSAHNNIHKYLNRELELRISTLQICDPDEVFSSEVAHIIKETLSSLPARTRRIFEMSRFEGESYKKIAGSFGITVKGVDYHITHTLNKLRIALKDYVPLLVYIIRLFE